MANEVDRPENKRRFDRRKCSTKVGVLVGGHFSFHEGVEISEGGMLLRANASFVVGQTIELNFFVPDGTFATASGEIAYAFELSPTEHFFGIRFVETTLPARMEIRLYVESAKEF